MKRAMIFLGLFLTSCTTSTLLPGAENVRVTSEPVSKNCRDIGMVTAEDTNGVTQSYTSHAHLIEDETNNLKDQAFAVGGNTVQITEHDATYLHNQSEKPQYRSPNASVNEHRLRGEAYFCPNTPQQEEKN